MHLKTALVAVAAAAATVGVAAQSDYGDTLSSIYSKAGLSVVISTEGKSNGRTTFVVNCAPSISTMSDFDGCLVGDGATIVKGLGAIDMETVSGKSTISQHCTYSGTADPVCTAWSMGPQSTSAFTKTLPASFLGLGPAATGTASTKASPAASTATATSAASSSSSSSQGASSAEQSATQTTSNAAMPQATGKAWAVGGAVMALALAVA